MREQRDAPAVERLAQRAVEQQAVDAEFHRAGTRSVNVAGSWKSGLSPPCASAQYERAPSVVSMTAVSARVDRCRLREFGQRRDRDLCAQRAAIRQAAALDPGRRQFGRGAVAAAAGEAVGRPVAGRREIELVIAVAPIGPQEYLEAGMLPETVAAACKFGRQAA